MPLYQFSWVVLKSLTSSSFSSSAFKASKAELVKEEAITFNITNYFTHSIKSS